MKFFSSNASDGYHIPIVIIENKSGMRIDNNCYATMAPYSKVFD